MDVDRCHERSSSLVRSSARWICTCSVGAQPLSPTESKSDRELSTHRDALARAVTGKLDGRWAPEIAAYASAGRALDVSLARLSRPRHHGDRRTGRPGPDGTAAMLERPVSGTAPSLRQVLAFEAIGVLRGDRRLGCGTRLGAVPAPGLGGFLKTRQSAVAEIRARPALNARYGFAASYDASSGPSGDDGMWYS
jgi:hypothetical protein